jgi:parallel beta-helix repeat protein
MFFVPQSRSQQAEREFSSLAAIPLSPRIPLHLMKLSLLETTGPLLATLATLLFAPAVTGAATVIDHVPYTITASGKYELQADLINRAEDQPFGITVKAANVIIDLNGFTLAHKSDIPVPSGIGIEVDSDNVGVRNGTISGFQWGVLLAGSRCKVQDLTLLGNDIGVFVQADDNSPLSNNAVVNCFIVGLGTTGVINNGIATLNASGIMVQGNQVSDCSTAIVTTSSHGNAIIHNYVANSGTGLDLSDHDCYQGNVATNCTTPFKGGHAVGGENGSD